MPRIYERAPLEQRFWTKVNKDGPVPAFRPELGVCWMWLGATVRGRYGKVTLGGKPGAFAYAHRAAFEMLRGPIPEGLHLDHLCRVTRCVNPGHLEPVTLAENNARTRRLRCGKGHAMTTDNLYVSPRGARGCRACRAQVQAARSCRRRIVAALGLDTKDSEQEAQG